MLKKGDRSPDICLPDERGEEVCLRSFIGKKNLVLFFYPKDETRICTQEVCQFRDNYQQIRDMGSAVLGISKDSVGSHRSFVANHDLPYRLLSDRMGKARRAFGVARFLFVLSSRVTFVIDKAGVIQHVVENALSAEAHVQGVLATLQKLDP